MRKLKEILKKLIEEESEITGIEVSGTTLEIALQKACKNLGVTLGELDYEILDFGNKGVFGVGKKDFRVKVYKIVPKMDIFNSIDSIKETDMENSLDIQIEEDAKNKDGEAFIHVTTRGVLLKIIPSVGRGKKVTETEAGNIITARGLLEYDRELVKKIVKESKGEYCRIGELPINVVNDSTASVQVGSDEMKAYLIITPPKQGGFDLEIEDIINILKSNSVVVGIKEDVLHKLIDYPIYNEPVCVAEGIKVKSGKDAMIHYNFNVNKDEIHLTEEDGKVDFKNLNIIQNIVAGQILASKEPASKGEPGRTVTNKLIPAKEGKDISMFQGKNTHITEDGMSVIAEKNGQVLIYAGKITVEEIFTVAGDVNLKTGNVTFLGTVVIQGSVEDGFSVKAAGNIEIHGSVGKCVLEADGDIIISQGFMGKGEGTIRAGKSIYAKFIENAKKVDASEGVYVQDGIMNSFIDATKEVTCVGKRGTIVGGRIRCGELLKSKVIGSVANVSTIIEVGIDPKKRQRLDELNERRDKAYKELEPINANLNNLENIRKSNKSLLDKIEAVSYNGIIKKMVSSEEKNIFINNYIKNDDDNFYYLKEDIDSETKKNIRDVIGKYGYLPQEKEELYQKFHEQASGLQLIVTKTQEEVDEIEKYLSQLKTTAKVIGSKTVYPGVKIYIKNAMPLEIKTEYKKVSFYLQGQEVNVSPFTEDEIRR